MEYVAVEVTTSDTDFDTVPPVAVIVAVCGGADAETATGKATEVRPQEMLTEAGTVSPLPFHASLIGNPVKLAADVIAAVHVVDAPTGTVVRLQVKLLSDCA